MGTFLIAVVAFLLFLKEWFMGPCVDELAEYHK